MRRQTRRVKAKKIRETDKERYDALRNAKILDRIINVDGGYSSELLIHHTNVTVMNPEKKRIPGK